jgi:hypothetical protein
MVPALRVRGDKPVNDRKVNTHFGRQFDSAQFHEKGSVKSMVSTI